MEEIKYYNIPDLKNPIMIASWSGMGNVGLGAVDYLRIKLNATLFAETNISKYILPEAVTIRNGVSSIIRPPNLSVYFTKEPPLIISIGKEQFYGHAGIVTMENLLNIAKRFKVKRIFTGAAFPMYMSYQQNSKVYAASNTRRLLNWLTQKLDIEIMPEGQISGLNGLLLEAARKKRIESACLLATLPIYAISFPNPKASKAIIKTLAKIINIEIDTTELDLSIQELDRMLQDIEKQLKHFGIEEHKEQPTIKPHSDELPKRVLDKIERLFEEAKKDKRLAHKLKEELDRWDLFKVYEDRFLDLFRENQ